MPPKLLIKDLTLFLDRIMTVLPTPGRHGFQAAPEPFPHGPKLDYETPSPTPLRNVREAEEVEGGWLLPVWLF